MTFQLTPTWYYFEAYRLLSPFQWLVHPSQRNCYRKMSLEHGVQITQHLNLYFRKWITRHMTFQFIPNWYYFEAYRLLSPSQWLLHPSQRNYYRKMSLEHGVKITHTLNWYFRKWITRHVTFPSTPTWYYCWTRWYYFRDTIDYHSNPMTCAKHPNFNFKRLYFKNCTVKFFLLQNKDANFGQV